MFALSSISNKIGWSKGLDRKEKLLKLSEISTLRNLGPKNTLACVKITLRKFVFYVNVKELENYRILQN